MVWIVVSPWFADTSTFGFHDWDTSTAFRYLVPLSLLRYGEFPSFNPYHCGGYPLWGYVEGATNLVSPWFPVYALTPVNVAIRLEAAGMGLLGAFGAFAVAGRFTRSFGARLLVAALWAVNGRWGLQTAAGHTWHLAYAWLPWCLFFYERARQEDARLREYVGAGVCFAMLVYAGGIYPLPHTVLALMLYACALAVGERRLRPLTCLALCGAIAIGLAAPKLLPLLETFSVDPRVIVSRERFDLGPLLTALTHPDQPFYARPAAVRPYGWHEWGMYISWYGVALLLMGLAVRGIRERALKVVGVVLGVLGLGAFHEYAPWTLLHDAPVFRSQHVPSRFLYPAVLFLALCMASGLGRLIHKRRRKMPWLDLSVAVLAALLAVDIAKVAQQPMKNAMWMEAPKGISHDRPFSHRTHAPINYVRRDWAAPMLLSMAGNIGVIDCYGVPRSRDVGALASDDDRYRGLAYLVPDQGTAVVREWSPSRALIDVDGAADGAMLVYNMNHWQGWSSDAGEVVSYQHAVAVKLDKQSGPVELAYVPPGLYRGIALFTLTVLGLVVVWRRTRQPSLQRPKAAHVA